MNTAEDPSWTPAKVFFSIPEKPGRPGFHRVGENTILYISLILSAYYFSLAICTAEGPFEYPQQNISQKERWASLLEGHQGKETRGQVTCMIAPGLPFTAALSKPFLTYWAVLVFLLLWDAGWAYSKVSKTRARPLHDSVCLCSGRLRCTSYPKSHMFPNSVRNQHTAMDATASTPVSTKVFDTPWTRTPEHGPQKQHEYAWPTDGDRVSLVARQVTLLQMALSLGTVVAFVYFYFHLHKGRRLLSGQHPRTKVLGFGGFFAKQGRQYGPSITWTLPLSLLSAVSKFWP